jgi:hypothetical protein
MKLQDWSYGQSSCVLRKISQKEPNRSTTARTRLLLLERKCKTGGSNPIQNGGWKTWATLELERHGADIRPRTESKLKHLNNIIRQVWRLTCASSKHKLQWYKLLKPPVVYEHILGSWAKQAARLPPLHPSHVPRPYSLHQETWWQDKDILRLE